jgi:hypothetical protein
MRFQTPFDFGRKSQHACWIFRHIIQADDSDEIMANLNADPLNTPTSTERPEIRALLPA